MTPEVFIVVAVIMYLLGGAVSIGLPYLRKYAEGETQKFEWRKAAGRFIGILVAAPSMISAGTIADLQVLQERGWLGVLIALVYGIIAFGASSVGHQTQSTPKAIRAYRNK